LRRAGVTRQAVTKHLHVLAGAGLVRGARVGRDHVWEIEPTRLGLARARDIVGGAGAFSGPRPRLVPYVTVTRPTDEHTGECEENESLHLGGWVKAMRSTIHLYDALARLPRR
jgi:DNA-binding transcriptional ArsR family regulator